MKHVIAVDPGGTTGIAVWRGTDDIESVDLPTWDAVGFVHRQLEESPDLVVCESFRINAHTAKKSQDGLASIESIGALRYLCALKEVSFELQPPSDAKSFAKDDKLKRIGWYIPGTDHCRDAQRHLLLALSRHRAVDLKRLMSKV